MFQSLYSHGSPIRLIIIAIASIVLLVLLLHPTTSPSPIQSSLLSVSQRFSHASSASTPTWLIATISSCNEIQRRSLIRQTWQSLFPSPHYDLKFVISNYSEVWSPIIEQENKTYGDIVCLWHIPENNETANTIKTMEYITSIANGAPHPYDWFTKLDTDTFFNPHAYESEYLAPIEAPSTSRTVIGLIYDASSTRHYPYPSGRLYTLSWDLVTAIAARYSAHPIKDEAEDTLIGHLLHDSPPEDDLNWVSLPWAKIPNIGDNGYISEETYIMHNLKSDERYLQVASLFDASGYIQGKEIKGITSYDASLPETMEHEEWSNRTDGFSESAEDQAEKDRIWFDICAKRECPHWRPACPIERGGGEGPR